MQVFKTLIKLFTQADLYDGDIQQLPLCLIKAFMAMCSYATSHSRAMTLWPLDVTKLASVSVCGTANVYVENVFFMS